MADRLAKAAEIGNTGNAKSAQPGRRLSRPVHE